METGFYFKTVIQESNTCRIQITNQLTRTGSSMPILILEYGYHVSQERDSHQDFCKGQLKLLMSHQKVSKQDYKKPFQVLSTQNFWKESIIPTGEPWSLPLVFCTQLFRKEENLESLVGAFLMSLITQIWRPVWSSLRSI